MTETKPLTTAPNAIASIAKNVATAGVEAPAPVQRSLAAFAYPADHPAMALWLAPAHGAIDRIAAAMAHAQAHPARTVVVLPYAQLLPLATRLWAKRFPDGFVPRFETTLNWSAGLQPFVAQATDISFDPALDVLTAQALLSSAGLAAHQDALAGLLAQAAVQLAALAAACHPAQRSAWAQSARPAALTGMEAPALQLEAAVARIAVEWAAASSYATDVLFDPRGCGELDLVVGVQGLATEPLYAGLQAAWGSRWASLALSPGSAGDAPIQRTAGWAMHPCLDAEDEAQRTAALALRHIDAGQYPLALVSADRALTRRVRAMLDAQGVALRDETGWKLSTSAAAAQVMALLAAGRWNATGDQVLAWLKQAPLHRAVRDALEQALRKAGARDWKTASATPTLRQELLWASAMTDMDRWIAQCAGTKSLGQWLELVQQALAHWGCWEALVADGPGAQVLAVLRLQAANPAEWGARLQTALWAGRRLDLAGFTHWANEALEAASFQTDYPDAEEVVILPMSQMLGRPFAAVILAGCDEIRLNPGAEPPGGWTAAQRTALGLPTRDVLEQTGRAAWQCALQTPIVDVVWRTSDEAGEPLMPSPWVRQLQWEQPQAAAPEPRALRHVAVLPSLPPQPTGARLPLASWSASAYEDLRQCPYRFFALRQLGLRAVDELEGDLDKRDFGVWLHAVLKEFHVALLADPGMASDARRQLLDRASADVTRSMGLDDGEFLPFAAAWPAVREGYLAWQAEHERSPARFVSAETALTQPLGTIKLVGRIDRTDIAGDVGGEGQVMVVDYKTEPLAKTRSRVKEPLEDTQMAFYAALLPNDTVRGLYVNLSEKDGTKGCEQVHLVEARDALIEGLLQDVQDIAGGAALPALGEGVACDFCDARGLCRKDFWSAQ